jgi:L-alanine-DL-glutamate epimerase-like enolase superfamily enzyme
MGPALTLDVRAEHRPLRRPVAVSGEVITSCDVVVVTLHDGRHAGRGECSPMSRFGHSVAAVSAELDAVRPLLSDGLDHASLQTHMPRGPARNALDCAWWDLEAKRGGRPIWDLLGLACPPSLSTLSTIGLDTPERMATEARARAWPQLKLKLGARGDLDRVKAVRETLPEVRLFVDVNEGWTFRELDRSVEPLQRLRVEAIEQPLPVVADDALCGYRSPVPLIADESCQDTASLDALAGKYEGINVKLDKCGGLTEALRLAAQARERGLRIMAGCMAGTSLAMAPAYVVASQCGIVDLDAPKLLAGDRDDAIRYADGHISAFSQRLWG